MAAPLNDRIATLTLNPALDLATETAKLRPTEKLRCTAPQVDPGGGGINVARVVRELGGDAVAVFPEGGASGALIVELLRAAGVRCETVPIAGVTRESFSVTERETGLQYRFVLPGPGIDASAGAALIDRIAALAPAWLVLSGSFPPDLPPDFTERLGATARRVGARLILDTGTDLAAIGRATGAWLIKPNRSELEAAAGGPLADRDAVAGAARRLLRSGAARCVVVSLGADGALFVDEQSDRHVPAPAVTPVSAVGAGDSMVAALTLALARAVPIEDALRYGVAAGAAALLTPGTGLVRRADVERLAGELPR